MDTSQSVIQTLEWKALQSHMAQMAAKPLSHLFAENHQRFSHFTLSAAGIFLDYSNNHCDTDTLQLLCQLAERCELPKAIHDLFNAEVVNRSEKRPALHTALRDSSAAALLVAGRNIIPDIQAALQRMEMISLKIREGQYLGFSGRPITSIVNIGIGGSDLGPKMAVYALRAEQHPSLRMHFVSNLDNRHLEECLSYCDPATTLFIVSSKTFTTHETLSNLNQAKKWVQQAAVGQSITQHFMAVTAATDKALSFGFAEEAILPFWSWVGGRYSLWSAVGLSIAIAIGMPKFKELLEGAYAMDQHFKTAPLNKNMPVLLGLIGIWYSNFFKCQTQAVIPYYQGLNYLPDYLQQLCMESLGKSVQYNGTDVAYTTGSIIWGGQGTNTQHSFHQLLLQGTHQVPTDFVFPLKVRDKNSNHHEMIANCLAQSEVFTFGYTPGVADAVDEVLRSHVKIGGNRPHNLIMLEDMTPKTLGALIALYEHKVYVQSVIWRINAFDQWGVQRAKQLTETILAQLSLPRSTVRTSGLMHMIAEKMSG